ncbi:MULTISPECIES: TolB family protein [Rhizobium]|uniref:TolB family protein n=1 Tax=Rhizobium TaxID=379 RepID=UPI0007F093B0|nr:MULTISPECIES: PD40 domain-containing protein [Rhizobium]ANK91567.1 TolB-like protein [Rhizobium sp. N6212]ANK97600.1 TolB-like protein [Rhizobium sp. N621]ANL03680.1 TolB-like protein [Rhizobium esperanzae]ANL09726.1 TolB-like protein [Rhizobium sp. N1341]ANL21777.1 TolB-like protein [Rhizobium sp. N113]
MRDLQLGTTTRINVDSEGGEAFGGYSGQPSVSADGRYVAFDSGAFNLVAGDTNGSFDIFVHDLQFGTTTRVSVDSGGVQGNGHSTEPSISNDGRYIAFQSAASNLVAGDTNFRSDIFVRDLQLGTTTRVSVDSAGVQGDGHSNHASISNDGRYVAFDSTADNLVAGDTNGFQDVFVRDLQLGMTTRVSVGSEGGQANFGGVEPSISGDGRYVAFRSDSSNLVAGDTNGTSDIFVRDLQLGTTTRVSVYSAGGEANGFCFEPSISADGRYVAFTSEATNLVAGDTNGTPDVFVRDLQLNTTTRVSVDSAGGEANYSSYEPSISADGRYVTFASDATNLFAGDTNGATDTFVADGQLQGWWLA